MTKDTALFIACMTTLDHLGNKITRRQLEILSEPIIKRTLEEEKAQIATFKSARQNKKALKSRL